MFWSSDDFPAFSVQPQILLQRVLKQHYPHHIQTPKMKTLNQTDLSSHFGAEIRLHINLLLNFYLTCKKFMRRKILMSTKVGSKYFANVHKNRNSKVLTSPSFSKDWQVVSSYIFALPIYRRLWLLSVLLHEEDVSLIEDHKACLAMHLRCHNYQYIPFQPRHQSILVKQCIYMWQQSDD